MSEMDFANVLWLRGRKILRDLGGGSGRLESQDTFDVVKDKTFGILVDASKYGDNSLLSQGGSGRRMCVS
jgi:hypothetical protein